MSVMEFVLVAHAIIVGLGVAELLRGFADFIRADRSRPSIRLFAIAAWTLLLLLQVWWNMWRLGERQSWTFVDFMVLLLPVAILYVMARVAFPRRVDDSDLQAYYGRVSPVLWILVAVTYVSFVLLQPVIYGTFLPLLIGTQLTIAVAAVVASRTRGRGFHLVVLAAMFAQVAWRAMLTVVS